MLRCSSGMSLFATSSFAAAGGRRPGSPAPWLAVGILVSRISLRRSAPQSLTHHTGPQWPVQPIIAVSALIEMRLRCVWSTPTRLANPGAAVSSNGHREHCRLRPHVAGVSPAETQVQRVNRPEEIVTAKTFTDFSVIPFHPRDFGLGSMRRPTCMSRRNQVER